MNVTGKRKKASETQQPDVWKAYKTKKLTLNKKVKGTKKDYYKHQIEGEPLVT